MPHIMSLKIKNVYNISRNICHSTCLKLKLLSCLYYKIL